MEHLLTLIEYVIGNNYLLNKFILYFKNVYTYKNDEILCSIAFNGSLVA